MLRLSLGLLASVISVASLPVIAQEDSVDNPKLQITGAAGANNPKTRTNTGKVGTFEEYTNPCAAAELGFRVDFDGLGIETTYAVDSSQLNGYTNANGIDLKYILGGEV